MADGSLVPVAADRAGQDGEPLAFAIVDRMIRVGRCEDCGFDWDRPGQNRLVDVATIAARYNRRLCDDVDRPLGPDVIAGRPAEGVWSALEYLAHMDDVTGFYLERIKRVLIEDQPVLHVQGRLAELVEGRSAEDLDPDQLLASLDRKVTTVSRLLVDLEPDQWLRVGQGSEGGERTVDMLTRRLAHEADHHLVDIDQIIERRSLPR